MVRTLRVQRWTSAIGTTSWESFRHGLKVEVNISKRIFAGRIIHNFLCSNQKCRSIRCRYWRNFDFSQTSRVHQLLWTSAVRFLFFSAHLWNRKVSSPEMLVWGKRRENLLMLRCTLVEEFQCRLNYFIFFGSISCPRKQCSRYDLITSQCFF